MANHNFINWRDNLKKLSENILYYILKLIREYVIKSFH